MNITTLNKYNCNLKNHYDNIFMVDKDNEKSSDVYEKEIETIRMLRILKLKYLRKESSDINLEYNVDEDFFDTYFFELLKKIDMVLENETTIEFKSFFDLLDSYIPKSQDYKYLITGLDCKSDLDQNQVVNHVKTKKKVCSIFENNFSQVFMSILDNYIYQKYSFKQSKELKRIKYDLSYLDTECEKVLIYKQEQSNRISLGIDDELRKNNLFNEASSNIIKEYTDKIFKYITNKLLNINNESFSSVKYCNQAAVLEALLKTTIIFMTDDEIANAKDYISQVTSLKLYLKNHKDDNIARSIITSSLDEAEEIKNKYIQKPNSRKR